VIPQKPHPHWSWDRIPTAFQGAQKDRAFNADEVSRLAKYQMLTLEKWYTPCASQGPTQSGPACDVEDKMLQLYALTKAISPKQIAIFYWNTMFDFAFYKAHGHMLAMEAAGLPSFLRDEHGEIMRLCNDGNVYCNITTFDWTQPHVASCTLRLLASRLAQIRTSTKVAISSATVWEPKSGATILPRSLRSPLIPGTSGAP
jgi:hypothetical protein